MPKVSIITVCYNSSNTIEQTIRSVLNQTYHNIEYIIVDGNSTDGTLDILEKYKDKLILISEPDGGIYHAMNKGIMRASGDIIGIINSDDWYEGYAVETAVRYLGKDDYDMAYGKCMWVYGDGIMQENICHHLEELRYRMCLSHQTVFIRRTVYEKYGIFNQKYNIAADYDLVLRFYGCGIRIIGIPENLAFFRQSGISNKNYLETLRETREISLCHWDGESIEIKEKIEKYSEYRWKFYEVKNILDKQMKDVKDRLETIFCKDRGYVIFGAGSLGIMGMAFLRRNGIPVENFIDNSTEKNGREYGGIEVKTPGYLMDNRKNIIVANLFYKEEIGRQLTEMGYKKGIDFVSIEDLVRK